MSSLITLDANAVTEIAAIQSKVLAIGERFALLTIEGPEDKAGFDRVHEARMQARDLRLDVQKRHETAKKAALEFGRKLDEAKRNIVGLIEPIEADLQAKEDAYKAAKEEIKRKEAEAKKARLQARIDAVQAVGAVVSIAVLEALTDEQFAAELAKATAAHEERKAAEEKSRVERERQEAEQEAKHAKLQARLDQMVVYEVAFIPAPPDPQNDTPDIQADYERREAMKPDLEKLRDYVAAIEAVPIPEVQDKAVSHALFNLTGEVERACQRAEWWCDEQAK